jgi:hypothetical protein
VRALLFKVIELIRQIRKGIGAGCGGHRSLATDLHGSARILLLVYSSCRSERLIVRRNATNLFE